MNKVGFCYLYQGRGAVFDIDKSFLWFKKGAEKGNTGCMMMLSQFYISGVGVAQSDEIAKKWMRRVIEIDDDKTAAAAKRRLDDFEMTRTTLTALMTTAVEMNGIPPR